MTRTRRLVHLLGAGALLALAAPVARAADWYVGPAGSPKGKGTREAPWDVVSALGGKQPVKPGDTLYLLAGTYRRRPQELFEVRLVGAEGKPIQVRPAPGARATIDGGLSVQPPSAHVWVRGLEIIVSEPQPARPVGPGSHPAGFNRPWGGVHQRGGSHCKFINLVIHDTRQGMSLWAGSPDREVHGCLIHGNGWRATDRGHGHGIYTQNDKGLTTLSDCIFTGGLNGTYAVHAYGSRKAYVNNYLVEGNILDKSGPLLIGGGRPSENIRVRDNIVFGTSIQVGYTAPFNLDCEVRGNVVVNGGLSINRYKKAVNKDNLVLAAKTPRPKGARVILRPNKYDPRRANLAVFNWDRAGKVAVDASAFLRPGDAYRLMRPDDFYGKPVLTGTWAGQTIAVPVTGEFAAFVLLRAPAGK